MRGAIDGTAAGLLLVWAVMAEGLCNSVLFRTWSGLAALGLAIYFFWSLMQEQP